MNLLGKYGNFEVDSNGDGLADMWFVGGTQDNSHELVSGIIGSNSQRLTHTLDGSGTFVYSQLNTILSTTITNGSVVYVSFYFKTSLSEDYAHSEILLQGTGNTIFIKVFNVGTDKWVKAYGTLRPDEDKTKLLINTTYHNSVTGTVTTDFDGVILVDLTSMGVLPEPMQEFFGVTNWSDLDDDTL